MGLCWLMEAVIHRHLRCYRPGSVFRWHSKPSFDAAGWRPRIFERAACSCLIYWQSRCHHSLVENYSQYLCMFLLAQVHMREVIRRHRCSWMCDACMKCWLPLFGIVGVACCPPLESCAVRLLCDRELSSSSSCSLCGRNCWRN